MTSFNDISLVFLAVDSALFLALPLLSVEIKKVMKTNEAKTILKLELPTNWVKAGIITTILAFFSFLVYAIVNSENILLDLSINLDALFYFGLLSFTVAIVYTTRLVWFMIDPQSSANIFTGKFLRALPTMGISALVLIFIGLLQSYNGYVLYRLFSLVLFENNILTIFGIIYLITLLASFVAMFPTIYLSMIKINERVSYWYLVAIFVLFSPWMALIINSIF